MTCSADPRSVFLNSYWHRYPQYKIPDSEKCFFVGRITSLTQSESSTTLQLTRTQPNRVHSFEIGDCPWTDLVKRTPHEPPLPKEVLSIHDIVCIEVSEPNIRDFSKKVKHAQAIQLLSPHLAPPLATAATYDIYVRWQSFLASIRDYFELEGFTPMQTPTLVPSPGSEPYLDPFSTTLLSPDGRKTCYLPTSPELHLKKALSMGWERIYEIRPCFRNGEWGSHHRPEFYMLEWYRAYATLENILSDCSHLLSHLTKALGQAQPPAIQVMTIQESFQKFVETDFVLHPDTSEEELSRLAKRIGISTQSNDSWDDIFFRIFLEKVEPNLEPAVPTILCNYPPSQAALARISQDGWADRFEFYWQGLEIANAFHELNDPIIQLQRLNSDNKRKIQLGKSPVPIDPTFMQALKAGMPPSGGIALGLERLFLALSPGVEMPHLRPFETN